MLLDRHDATWMQNLGAGTGDFLSFIVIQRAQQTGIGNCPRIGTEHARHIRPDFKTFRLELGCEITTRSI